MHRPLQLRFVSLAHPSAGVLAFASPAPIHVLGSCAAYLPAANGFLRLLMTQRRRKKVQSFSVKLNTNFRTRSCRTCPAFVQIIHGLGRRFLPEFSYAAWITTSA